jgi:hypothetical protein
VQVTDVHALGIDRPSIDAPAPGIVAHQNEGRGARQS